MIQYMSPFIPKLNERTSPLRKLLKSDIEWNWTKSHEILYTMSKEELHNNLCLTYFDPMKTRSEQFSKCISLSTDIGRQTCNLRQKIVDRYREKIQMISVVFTCERFHTYIYGKEVTIQSYDKALESIQLKTYHKHPKITNNASKNSAIPEFITVQTWK